MKPVPDSANRRWPHADIWAVGILFLLSRVPWVVAQYYHSHEQADALLLLSVAASLAPVLLAYLLAAMVTPRVFSGLMRFAVLTMFLFLAAVQARQFLSPGAKLSLALQAGTALAGLAIAGLGALKLAAIWPRLRTALIAAAFIGVTSVFALAALLAPRIELLADGLSRHRPVVVLLLDEFSAGSSAEIVADLRARALRVDAWSVPSAGKNTIDAIPAIFSGVTLTDARPCTKTAVCGGDRVVDFARLGVARGDVDIVGIYHHYCAIAGLRHCVNPERGSEGPLVRSFFCALPLRLVLAKRLGCDFTGYAAHNAAMSVATDEHLFRAPFWRQGGLLYAHLFMPHPPGLGGEPRLAEAYQANLDRTGGMVGLVIDRLDAGPLAGDYTLVITSDHPLRAEFWCTVEPFASHDCALPSSMRGPEIPFIVATRGGPIAHAAPRSNLDLFPIVSELSAPRAQ